MADRHLPHRDVEEITGLSRTSIYRLMDRGEFPRPVRVTQKAVRWPESVVTAWLAERAKVPA